MKLSAIFLMFCVAFATCEINMKTFDWSSVKPLYEIEEWRKLHHKVIPFENAVKHSSVRTPRIIDGNFIYTFNFCHNIIS